MANPLFRNFGNQEKTHSKKTDNLGNLGGKIRNFGNGIKDIKSIIRIAKSGGDPQAIFGELLSHNPDVVKQITPFLNGLQDPKQFVMDYCKQNNTSPEELLQQLGFLD